jgi:hypothetical protein
MVNLQEYIMKINPENPNISSNRPIERDRKEKAAETNQDDPSSVKLRDRVEISGDSSTRTTISGKSNPYSSTIVTDDTAISSQNLTKVSSETKLSQARLDEIKQRINSNFYDSEQVINSVAKLMFQDVKKVDQNI